MAVKIMLQFNGRQLTLPINPEELNIIRSTKNEDIDIIGLGHATRKGEPGLIGLTIESFLPGPNSYYYTGVSPRSCIEFINSIWEAENTNNNVGKLVTSGLPIDLNFYFVIDNFDYDHKAGEEEDIYYTLKIKKYIPYGVKTVEVQLSGLAAARASALASNNATTNNNSSNTYIVQRGDCLWNIAKACTGNGNDWRQLYELNKSVIGSNPNLIKPGQVLTLPTGWRSPQKVTKLSNISAGTTSASKATNTNAPAGALYTNQSEPALDRTLAFARSVMQEAAKQSGGVKEEKKVFKGYAGKSNGTNTFGYEDEFGDFHVYWPGSGNKRE